MGESILMMSFFPIRPLRTFLMMATEQSSSVQVQILVDVHALAGLNVVQNHAVLDAVNIHHGLLQFCVSCLTTVSPSSFMISAMRINLPFFTCFQ